eukprot:5528890-Pyramimonas_sp.AAC.1
MASCARAGSSSRRRGTPNGQAHSVEGGVYGITMGACWSDLVSSLVQRGGSGVASRKDLPLDAH